MRRLLAGLFMAIFAIAFEMIGVATALPTVMESLGASHLYPWAFSTLVIGQLLTTIVAGYAADRVGPTRPIIVGCLLFLAGLVLGAVAGDVGVLLAARFVQGLGAGCLSLALFVSIALAFDGPQRASVMGALSFVWLLPAFVGPPLAAWMAVHNWRLVFVSAVPVVLVAMALLLPGMKLVQARFTPSKTRDRMRWGAVVAVSLAPGAIQLAGEGLGIWGVVALVVGVVSLPLALHHVLPARVRGFGPGLGSVVLTRALQAGCFFAAEAFVLLVLKDLRGLTPFRAGLALTVGSTGWSLGSWAQARPWFRMRRDNIITLGAAMCLVGMAAMVAFVAFELPIWLGLASWTVASLGMGVLMPSCAVATMDLSARHEQGRNNSALQVAEGLGNALLTGVAGAVFAVLSRNVAPRWSFVAVFSVLALASLASVLVSRRVGKLPNASAGAQRVRK